MSPSAYPNSTPKLKLSVVVISTILASIKTCLLLLSNSRISCSSSRCCLAVAITTTVYVYVSGLGSAQDADQESVSVVGRETDDQIKLVLASGGKNYDDGYNLENDVNIFVNGNKVAVYTTGSWETGGQILLGNNGATWQEGFTCIDGDYEVTVVIKDTVVFDGTIKIG